MKKRIMSKNNGITMVSLAIVVIVILILTGVLIYNVKDSLGISNLKAMQNDIQNLRDMVSNYYSINGKIPAKIKDTNTENIERIRAAGVISEKVDIGDFYIIDLKELENLTLNYGEDYKNITDATTELEASQYTDIYIINETSQNIFYVEGIRVDEDWFYTDYTSEDVDTVAVNLRYFDGVKIPDGYTYNSGTNKEDLSIKNKDDETKIYNWVITSDDITEIPDDVQITEDEKADFIKSVNLFDGYYKNNTDNTVLYIENEEKWSPTYDVEGTYKDKNGDTAYIPKGFQVSEKRGETLIDEGLVIRNATTDDRYVWIEVPKSIYKTATSETDYANIEKDMQNYTEEYKEGYEGYTDTWYSGCGISSEEEYNNLKNQMLTSVYNNGGFYISQYEIGSSDYVTENDNGARTPVSKEGMYPYNYVTVAQAQQLATNMDSGEKTSSLMFGVQWDLVLKFLETKGVAVTELKDDSSSWGNYINAEFVVNTRGEYSTYNKSTSTFEEWNEIPENYTKPSSGNENMILLMTGIVDRNSKLNIYDLAGNSCEFTLEKNGNDNRSICVSRGGDCNRSGLGYSASYRDKITTAWYWGGLGFRSTIY